MRKDTADFTSIRIPRATSTISASFMQYTVLVAGSLAVAAGTTAVLLLLGIFTCVVLFSTSWAVIHVGRTLFLVPASKASISLVSHEEGPGPKLSDFRTANPTLSSHQELQVCPEGESSFNSCRRGRGDRGIFTGPRRRPPALVPALLHPGLPASRFLAFG